MKLSLIKIFDQTGGRSPVLGDLGLTELLPLHEVLAPPGVEGGAAHVHHVEGPEPLEDDDKGGEEFKGKVL